MTFETFLLRSVVGIFYLTTDFERRFELVKYDALCWILAIIQPECEVRREKGLWLDFCLPFFRCTVSVFLPGLLLQYKVYIRLSGRQNRKTTEHRTDETCSEYCPYFPFPRRGSTTLGDWCTAECVAGRWTGGATGGDFRFDAGAQLD